VVIANAVVVRGAFSAFEFVTSAAQAVCGWLPGCSANVVPGAPESASAEPAESAAVAATRTGMAVIRLMFPPCLGLFWWWWARSGLSVRRRSYR
jgi:hypothetical protein